MTKRRLFNKRPMVFAAVFLCLGILSAAFITQTGGGRLFRLIPLGLGAATAVAMLILRLFKKQKCSLRLLYIPIMLIIGVIAFSAAEDIYCSRLTDNTGSTEITGTVGGPVYLSENGFRYFTVTDAYIGEEKLAFDVRVIFEDGEFDFNAGDIVRIKGNLKAGAFKAFDPSFTSDYENRIIYGIFAVSVNKAAEGELPPLKRFVHENKRRIAENTRSDTAGLATGMLFGDASELGNGYDDVAAAGLIHILCVSGLHVGFLAGAVFALLKKLKVKGVIRLVIAVGIALLYSILCDFRPPSVRAVIMLAVLLSAGAFGFKYDAPSALAFAAILILIFDPPALFGISFLLSFGALAGLVLLYKPFFRVFRRLGKFIGGTLAASLATNVVLFPLIAVFFGKIQTLFWLSNLLILPIISFIFIIMFIIMLIVSIFPSFTFLYALFDFVLIPFKTVVSFTSSWRYSEIRVASMGIMSVVYYFAALACSQFLFATRKQKTAAVSVVTSACLIISAVI